MVLDRAETGRVDDGLWHEQGHIGHDADVRLEGPHQLEGLRRLPRLRLMDGEPLFRRERREWVFRPAFLVGGAEYRDDVLASLQEGFENGLAEGVLSMDYDAHLRFPFLLQPVIPMRSACAARRDQTENSLQRC